MAKHETKAELMLNEITLKFFVVAWCFVFSLVTGMNPLSPYLNVDPRYLVQVRLRLILLWFD